ncbi:unnamed protein product [Vitrella brassicaformis CCMP3155]|uniref:Uncharacterized protein n=1 Tax=Vitrella brassicaformis (strain CCMP3155) TaxID=1169540 RepID=A0A0G4ES93_VITBC|nr:unnamed protein product [Vitrella brassicaformis CCMP3155]|mmetsp:Transcript_27095/g.67522  ORF Transcript_27095/g.67522 Transcript_27095/m.67522 type:complete len:567 (-) Transcript_27095:1309-3009(-)|eukprot:CEM00541.1 unnamed protein product [Vitrella brassicaformis CCMP3155]
MGDTKGLSVSVRLPKEVHLSERDMCDLEMLLMGAFAPLKGYLTRDNYLSCLSKMRLTTGEVWPMPIVLSVPKAATEPAGESKGQRVLLRDQLGRAVAEVLVEDVYEPDLNLEMEKVLGSTDMNHPYAQHMAKTFTDCYYIGGEVRQLNPISRFDFKDMRRPAPEVKQYIKQQGWECVVGFQTRNPMHRSHFELTRQAMREAQAQTGKEAHLLLTPAVGPTQPGDVEYHIRVRCYKKLLKYYGENKADIILLPLAMRMAGPREAVWHAIIRANYGCTHFIVGRDHAGPSAKKADGSSFYGAYEAHELLASVQSELGIEPIFGKEMVYVGEEHGGYVQRSQVPEGVEPQSISGTQQRKMLLTREPIPEWFSYPDVVEELHKFYKPPHEKGFCMYFTGLPCSGKTTLATALEQALLENESETRKVTILDAPIIRSHLSYGLGFSKQDRSTNVKRIGFVASEIVKHGGICLVATIAPYEDDRQYNRKLITSNGGGYVEVYVSTPIEVCEGRDSKGLYKQARSGVIQQFTGVSDPYEAPTTPDLTIDSSKNLPQVVDQLVSYLKEAGWVKA